MKLHNQNQFTLRKKKKSLYVITVDPVFFSSPLTKELGTGKVGMCTILLYDEIGPR